MTVGQRFDGFLNAIKITDTQHTGGQNAHQSVRLSLNLAYYSTYSSTSNSMLTGSWGKDTEVRPPRDIDILFVLPDSMRSKYTVGNIQSQILQDVKRALIKDFPRTDIRGDGPVVKVPLSTPTVESTHRQTYPDPLLESQPRPIRQARRSARSGH